MTTYSCFDMSGMGQLTSLTMLANAVAHSGFVVVMVVSLIIYPTVWVGIIGSWIVGGLAALLALIAIGAAFSNFSVNSKKLSDGPARTNWVLSQTALIITFVSTVVIAAVTLAFIYSTPIRDQNPFELLGSNGELDDISEIANITEYLHTVVVVLAAALLVVYSYIYAYVYQVV